MKKILVATDFSESANNAAEYAINLAKEMNSEVVLLHVYHVPVPDPVVAIPFISPTELENLNEVALLKDVTELEKKTGIIVKHQLEMGFAVTEILALENKFDLIVMGMKGANGLSEVFFGSISTDVMKKTKKPLLLIPENAKYSGLKNIVFACDFDISTAIKTIHPLKELVEIFDSKLLILNVTHKNQVPSFNESISGLRLENSLGSINHSYHFPENENLTEEINHFSAIHEANLITIVPHRHTIIDRLFHESTSKRLAFQTDIPLLALPDMHKSIPVYAL